MTHLPAYNLLIIPNYIIDPQLLTFATYLYNIDRILSLPVTKQQHPPQPWLKEEL